MTNSQQDWQELCVRGGCVCARVLLTVDERIILVTEKEQTLLETLSPNGQIINLEMSYAPTLTIESTHVYKTNQSPMTQVFSSNISRAMRLQTTTKTFVSSGSAVVSLLECRVSVFYLPS